MNVYFAQQNVFLWVQAEKKTFQMCSGGIQGHPKLSLCKKERMSKNKSACSSGNTNVVT